jgi:hypothetical protein
VCGGVCVYAGVCVVVWAVCVGVSGCVFGCVLVRVWVSGSVRCVCVGGCVWVNVCGWMCVGVRG